MTYLDIARGLTGHTNSHIPTYRAYRAPNEDTNIVKKTEGHCEISEISPASGSSISGALDDVIARDVSRKHTRATIVAFVRCLETRAELPAASELDRRLAADWRRILEAKDGGCDDSAGERK
ncbi:MAG: hypothetical protein M3R06_10890 [Chloroflexota bacterium]|nr:hypothetical protein [Chloroflexota bacterium]